VLQTGARLIWDVEFGKILSLAPEVPSDVRLEYQGSKWAIKTAQANVITKTCDDQVHSSGSSSQNTAAPLPKLDVRRVLAKFPLVDTDGDSIPCLYVNAANVPCRLLRLDRVLCRLWPSIPKVEETPWNRSRGNGCHFDSTYFRSVSRGNLSLFFCPTISEHRFTAPPTTSSTQLCWTLVSTMSCIPLSCKSLITGPSFYLRNSVSLRSMQLRSRGASSIRTMCYGSGILVGINLYHARHELTGFIDTRVCDLTVYDDTGSVLVAMTGFELKRNSTSPFPSIGRRYEVALQPVVPPTVIPRCPTHWSRPDKETADLIVTLADHEAQLLLRRSLDHGVIVGDDLNRQRYYQFAKDAIARRLQPRPSPAVVEEIKTKWPIHFQIVDRLSHVHHDVFETSTVSLYLLSDHEAFLTYNIPGNCTSPVL